MLQFHQIDVPLPFKPYTIHLYAIQSQNNPDEILLIDSGVHKQSTLTSIEQGIKSIDSTLGLDSIKWIIPTHAHIDHIGALSLIQEQSSAEIIMHEQEYNYFQNEKPKHWINKFEEYGIPSDGIEQFNTFLNYYASYFNSFKPNTFIQGNQGSLPLPWEEKVRFVQISGHSPHHIALYIEEQKIMFIGDTVLSNISPNLGFSSLNSNPAGEYLSTMELLINEFEGFTVYPAHQDVIVDLKTRAQQLSSLLLQRLEQVKNYFSQNTSSKGFKSLINKIYPGVWDDTLQRFLAIMESMAYLKYFFGLVPPFNPPFEDWN